MKKLIAFSLIVFGSFQAFATAQTDTTDPDSQEMINFVRNSDITYLVLALDRGVDPNSASVNGTSALMYASKIGDARMARVLISFGADVNAVNDSGASALTLAAKYGNTEVAQMLVQNGATVDAKTKNGVTPAQMAKKYNHKTTADFLEAAGANR